MRCPISHVTKTFAQATTSSASSDAVARRVLETEIRGLIRLAQDMPEDFVAFVEAVLSCDGRLVISGVGKSAHIGRKIAATLASTGTPSMFVHATEASHGDLGMIVPGDICLVISNSGETSELTDVLGYCKRFSIPLAALTAHEDSMLASMAQFRLLIPKTEEACSIGRAPTTSTTVTLALGDALAVTLMENRGFSEERFHHFHPGGKLGIKLAKVSELMHGEDALPRVKGTTRMQDVLLTMTSRGFGAALVTDEEDRLIGLITDGDLRRHMDDLLSHQAADIATPSPTTVGTDHFAAEALAMMNALKISVLPVVDDAQRPIGILHTHDLLRAGLQ